MKHVQHLKNVQPTFSQKISDVAFWTMSLICLLNLNGVLGFVSKLNQGFSILILLCCIVIFIGNLSLLPEFLKSNGGIFLLFFGSYLLVAFVSSPDKSPTIFSLLQTYFSSLIVIIASFLIGRNWQSNTTLLHKKMLGIVFILTLAVVSIFFSDSLKVFGVGDSLETYSYSRKSGVFFNPNEAGNVGGILFGFLIAFLQKKKQMFWVIPLLLLCILGIYSTFSKTAFASILIISFVSILTLKKYRFQLLTLSVILLTFSIWFVLVGNELFEMNSDQTKRIQSIKNLFENRSLNDDVTTGRSTLWKLGWEKFEKEPFFGNGLGSLHYMKEAQIGVHNFFLIVLGEAGIFSFVLFLAFLLFFIVKSSSQEDPFVRAVSLSFIIVFVLMSFASHSILSFRPNNIFLGLFFGILYKERKNTSY